MTMTKRRTGNSAHNTVESLTQTTPSPIIQDTSNRPIRSMSSPTTSRQTRSKSLKSTRKTQFRPRTSRLDTDTMINEKPEFRGFFILFWIVLALFIFQSILTNRRREGVWFRTDLMQLFSKDLAIFGLSHLTMVMFTFLCLPVHWLLMKKWTQFWVAVLLKYLMELGMIGGSVWWIFARDLPWSQSITFLMHTCVMAMKVHSYLSVNGELEELYRRRHDLLQKHSRQNDFNGALMSPLQQNGANSSLDSLRGSTGSLDAELSEIQSELVKTGAQYPQTSTLGNYFDYLLVPTLVYELEYPRTERIRPLYIVEKVAATFGVVGTLYFMIEHFVYPTLRDLPNESLVESYVKLMIPFTLGWIMLFYIIFEGVCNAFAELTRFADRNFYDDWWNSCSFDEFARKWNKPVHEFLLRHVYLEAIDSYKVSKTNATFITFLFSSVFHELIAAVVARKFIMLFFTLQMSQLPLIWIFRLPRVRNHPLMANTFFWIALISGFPLIAILYTRDYFIHRDPELFFKWPMWN